MSTGLLCQTRYDLNPITPTLAPAFTPYMMAHTTKDAVFCLHIINHDETSYLERTHPVPTFLCEPDLNQQTSTQFYEAYFDILTLVNGLHHDECMSMITVPCICGSPAKDALKSPINVLHLAQPMIIMQVAPICGSEKCGMHARRQLTEKQNKAMMAGKDAEIKAYMSMECAVCKSPHAERCAGCDRVAYCGKECQKQAWKAHRSACKSRKTLSRLAADNHIETV